MDFLLRLARDVDDIKRDIAALRSAMRYRRAIGSVLMERDLISAVGGTLFVSKSAASVYVPMVVPTSGTWTLTVQDPPGGGFHFANSDICRITARVIDGDDYDTKETWFTVSSRVDNGDSTQSYTCTYQSGDKGYTYPSGAPVIGYGQSGDGYLMLTCDGANAPRYSIYTHAGSPWSAETERGRFGNMNGAFGVSTDVMGFGVGDYSAGNYLKYDTAGGFGIKAGGNSITLDGDALTFESDESGTYKWLRFINSSTERVASIASTRNAVGQLSIVAEKPVSYGGLLTPIVELISFDPGGTSKYAQLDGSGMALYATSGGCDLTMDGGLNIGTAAGAAPGELKMSGSIKESTAIGARVYRSTDQTLTTATLTPIAFDSERFDTDSIHDNSTNNSRLTCKTAGVYVISGTVRFATNATGNRRLLIRLNGTTYIAEHTQAAVSGLQTTITIATVYLLAANDYVELVALQSSGGDLAVSASGNLSPEFSMVRVA